MQMSTTSRIPLFQEICDRLGLWVETEKAQNMYFFVVVCFKLKIAVFGFFSITAQFGCLVTDGEPWKTVNFNILGWRGGGHIDLLEPDGHDLQ